MASVNKVIIVGNLGKDPEVRYNANGNQVTTISVATTESWKDKNTGDRQERTEWHRVQFWGRLAETAGQYLNKGSQVFIEGKLRTSKYTGKDGIERYSTDIVADHMQMLGGKSDGNQEPVQRQQPKPAQRHAPQRNSYADAKNGVNAGYTVDPDMNDDIPF